MAKYRKKPVIIEATQWFKNGDYEKVIVKAKEIAYHADKICTSCGLISTPHGWVDTLEGEHIVCPGDWIIMGVKGEHYPCKPDIFKLTYEEVDK